MVDFLFQKSCSFVLPKAASETPFFVLVVFSQDLPMSDKYYLFQSRFMLLGHGSHFFPDMQYLLVFEVDAKLAYLIKLD